MASIFTVRDKQGNIIEIPALQGPAGPKGPIGPEGPRGAGGIYVGSGGFPEGYTVQIDPNGDVENNITVDNTVTVGSTNPVSSAAVIAYIEERLAAIPNYNEVSV